MRHRLRREIRDVLKKFLINEEMKVSSDFINNEFIKHNKAISLEIGVDNENDIQHRLNLILSFGSPSGYEELSFYFNLTDKENTKITSKTKSIYDRNVVKEYLPPELVGQNIFINKLKEMLKELLKMETPDKFFMETFEDHTDRKQVDYYDNLVKIITENGYVIESQGVNPITKKYFWQFLNKKSLSQISESAEKHWKNFDVHSTIRDKQYWKKHDENVEETMKGINEIRRITKP